MHTRRRTIMTAGVGLLALAGCANIKTASDVVSQQTFNDVKLLADAFTPIATQVATLAGAGPAVSAKIVELVGQIEAAAATIQPGLAIAVAQPAVSTIGSVINQIGATLSQVPGLPATIQTILTAAQSLLPLIEAAVGIAVALGASQRLGTMSPSEARVVLRSAPVSLRH